MTRKKKSRKGAPSGAPKLSKEKLNQLRALKEQRVKSIKAPSRVQEMRKRHSKSLSRPEALKHKVTNALAVKSLSHWCPLVMTVVVQMNHNYNII